MGETVHVIPVGFDFERLIQPISQGSSGQSVDRVLLVQSATDPGANPRVELATQMAENLQDAFDRILGIDVDRAKIKDIYDYGNVYVVAYQRIRSEVKDGNDVHVNISSMPRTVAFAFATAAAALVIECPDWRDRIHTYYVSPEKYVIIDMIEELEAQAEFLDQVADELETTAVRERRERIEDLLTAVYERGVTRGAKQMNGEQCVEFPPPPMADLNSSEQELLDLLARKGPGDSISAVAEALAADTDETFDESTRSRVQYTVDQLAEKGYVQVEDRGNRHRVALSKMGRLWVRTH